MGVQAASASRVGPQAAALRVVPTAAHVPASWLASAAAGAALGLVPFWWHLDLVDPGVRGIIAVFAEVAVYPADACLVVLAVLAIWRPVALGHQRRWLAVGLALLAAAALLSTRVSRSPSLAAGLAGHLALLALAWLGIRSAQVSRAVLVGPLVASAAIQSVLATAQLILRQPLVPPELHLPWLPSDAAQAGAPVVLDPAGGRLLRGFGTFPHPNVLAGYLALALVCLPLLGQRWPRARVLWWTLGAIIGVGLLASLSRAGCLAATVGLGCWWRAAARHRPARGWLAVVPALTLAALAFSPLAPIVHARLLPFAAGSNALERGSIERRLALDGDAVRGLGQHLPLGIGGGNYGLVAVAEGFQKGWGEPAPNVALLIANELGLPGLLAAALIVRGLLGVLGTGRRLDVAATGVCLAVLVLSMLDHYLWTMPAGRVIAWVPLALIAAARH